MALPVADFAQSVHGVVRGTAHGGGLAGAVVVLLDSASADVAEAVANEAGRFVLRAPGAGSYVVRARRIGFRPSEVRVRLSHGDTALVITMGEVPVTLGTVVTRSSGQCRAHPEVGSAAWALWENAEVAMLNAAITRRDQQYRFDAEYTRRWYDIDPALLTDITLRDSTIRDTRPWTSVKPEVLRRSGFALETATEMTVIAPDLPVLLSRDFLDAHCFAIHASSTARQDLVGLDFAPVSRGRYVDIRGTFWLDRESGDLRYLNYYYAGFPFSMNDTLAGGRVGFTHLATGSWVMSSWSIRAPLPPPIYLARTVLATGYPSRPVQAGDEHFRSLEFLTTSAGVREVRGDSAGDSRPIWSAPVSALRAHVATRLGSGTVPAAGATVMIVGSRRQAVSDSDGVARIDGMMEGDYIVDAASPLQASLLLPPTRVVVSVTPPADAEIRTLVMSPEEAVHAACGYMNATRGILVGTVTRNGAPEPRAYVRVRSDVNPSLYREARPSSDGTFRVCDLPRGEALTVVADLVDRTVAIAGRIQARTRVTIATDHLIETVDLVVPPNP